MEPRAELIAAARGETVDRVPLWLREGYDYWRDPHGADAFRAGWMDSPEWRSIMDAAKAVRACHMCQVPVPIFNRFMMTSPDRVVIEQKQVDDDHRMFYGTLKLKDREIHFRDMEIRGMDMQWYEEVPAHGPADLEAIINTPFELDEAYYEDCCKRVHDINDNLIGKDTLYQLMFPDPIVAISRCMTFDDFLLLTVNEKKLLTDLLIEVSSRLVKVAEFVAPRLPRDIGVWAGGAEQCTPPIMAPKSYDKYVLPYTKPIMDAFKAHGHTLFCHCHGKVKYALDVMRRIGFDATEPVEPEPQGNVSLEEGFEIARGELTLMGNMEWLDLATGDEKQVRGRVRDMAKSKGKRLIVAASAGPTSAIDTLTMQNHLRWFDEYAKQFL